MSTTTDSDGERFISAVGETGQFAFQNIHRLIVVSVGWFLASLPVVTAGPATLAAYAAIQSMRTSPAGTIDRNHVRHVVKTNGANAAALGLLPAVFTVIGSLYLYQYAVTGAIQFGALGVLGVTAGMYAVIMLIPTFVSMAGGASMGDSLRTARTWTAGRPMLSLTTLVLTTAVAIVTILLMVAFVLIFAGIAFSYHVVLYSEDQPQTKSPKQSATGAITP